MGFQEGYGVSRLGDEDGRRRMTNSRFLGAGVAGCMAGG